MKKKALLMALAALVLVAVSVAGTLAYLTASASVTNTFTVGRVGMTLDETSLADSTKRTSESQDGYKIVPGKDIAKDPQITITANSENCYVFAYIKNGLMLTIGNTPTVVGTPNVDPAKWLAVPSTDGGMNGMYLYIGTGANSTTHIVPASTDPRPLDKLFTSIHIDETIVTQGNIAGLNNQTVKVAAFAHQSDAADYATAVSNAVAYFTTL